MVLDLEIYGSIALGPIVARYHADISDRLHLHMNAFLVVGSLAPFLNSNPRQ
jgi:hypothetical protein